MMSENDTASNPTVTPTNSPPSSTRFSPWFILALVALALLGWQWLETRHKLAQVEQEVAKRLADFDTANKEDHGVQKDLRQQVETLQAKLGAFESKLGEFQGQGVALQSLYQDAVRNREEVALLEVEQAITLASQQLQLTANVPVAILALQAADARLARLDRPQHLPLRKALAKDIAQLNALPVADVPGMSLRLEQVVIAIDKLPLAAYGRPPEKAENAQPSAVLPVWQQQGLLVWNELKSLVRIQRFDHEETALLAPGQASFLRENIKLRLLNARLALLSRDQATFRSELKAGQEALGKYFVADDKAVRAAVSSLQQMVSAPVSLDLPSLNDTLSALRTVRAAKDKR
jgi:uroporphyrin-3 C-methyltransferase